jgi:hypothetical protein
MERWSSTGAVGATKDFLFPQGIWVPSGQTLTVHNILGGATLDITINIQE